MLAQLPAAAGGDRDAEGRIVAACQNTVAAIALAITRDVPASGDIALEALLGKPAAETGPGLDVACWVTANDLAA